MIMKKVRREGTIIKSCGGRENEDRKRLTKEGGVGKPERMKNERED